MLKMVFCLRRRDDLSPEEFRRYWRERHAVLVQSLGPTLRMRRYVQSHALTGEINERLRQRRGTEEAYDGIAEVWWDRLEDFTAVIGTQEGRDAGSKLVEDEARFIDFSRSRIFLSEEVIVVDF